MEREKDVDELGIKLKYFRKFKFLYKLDFVYR